MIATRCNRKYSPIVAVLAIVLASCGPMSPQAAADHCEDRARLAQRPRGEVFAGIAGGSHGTRPVFGGEISVSSDWLQRRDPHQLYEDCVRQKTGQGPVRPLNLG